MKYRTTYIMNECNYQSPLDSSSINSFISSYHKILTIQKLNPIAQQDLPPLNHFLFISARLNLKPLMMHIHQAQDKSPGPIFTFQAWAKLKNEVRGILKKYFHQKLKEIHSGNLVTLLPGESLNVRTDHFCLSPHCVYTVLIPLQKCEMDSAAVAVSQAPKPQSQSQPQLLQLLQSTQLLWQYAILQQGDIVLIGRDCIYGTFRNDSTQPRHYVQMRWVKNDSSSSSSNSS